MGKVKVFVFKCVLSSFVVKLGFVKMFIWKKNKKKKRFWKSKVWEVSKKLVSGFGVVV